MEVPFQRWEKFALLLIDAQHDFWPDEFAQSFPHFPTRMAQLLSFCRNVGLEMIHLRAIFSADMSDWMVRYKLRKRIPCIEGTQGAVTLPFAEELPGEKVIVKQAFDGFQNPELFQYLQGRGKQFLLTAGLVTSTCVLFTTVSAAQKGFLTAVVEDCCADEPLLHEGTLETYQFIFYRTKTDVITKDYAKWVADLETLSNLEEGKHRRG
jgi:nicotinamidase-related amidase